VGNVLKVALVILGLIPSVAVLAGLIHIPPSLQQLVQIVTVPVSIVAVTATLVLSEEIGRWSYRRAALIFVVAAVLGASSAVGYFLFAGRCVIEYKDERIVAPMHPSQRIRDIIAVYNNQYDEALEHSPRNDELRELLAKENAGTTILMILLMVASQLLLVTARPAAIAALARWKTATAHRLRLQRLSGEKRTFLYPLHCVPVLFMALPIRTSRFPGPLCGHFGGWDPPRFRVTFPSFPSFLSFLSFVSFTTFAGIAAAGGPR
jgi:hypothetical protein